MYRSNSGSPSTRYARSRSGSWMCRRRHCSCATLMCFCASLLPTPREPECRNSQTRSASSSDTSTKWLPDPSVPSCCGQCRASASACPAPGVSRSSAIRGSALAPDLLVPATRRQRDRPRDLPRAARPAARPATSSAVNCVRTAIIPQPMSTPTAAGMIAPSVGMTEPTVAPMPRWASGMRARCGWMNGICAVRSACSRVLSSRIDAQLSRRALIFSIVLSIRSGAVRGAAQPVQSTRASGRRAAELTRQAVGPCFDGWTQ